MERVQLKVYHAYILAHNRINYNEHKRIRLKPISMQLYLLFNPTEINKDLINGNYSNLLINLGFLITLIKANSFEICHD